MRTCTKLVAELLGVSSSLSSVAEERLGLSLGSKISII